VYGVPPPEEIYTYRTLRDFFTATLDRVASRLTANKKLVILLDGFDHLTSSARGAQSLSWLPESWPRHVHVVLTTDTTDALTLRNLRNHVRRIVRRLELDSSVVDQCFFEVAPLDEEEQLDMFQYILDRSERSLMPLQREVG